MADSFRCVVATPTRMLFTGNVYYADVPGYVGHFALMKGHASELAMNHKGGRLTLWLDPDGNEKKTFLIHEGGSQMLHDHLTVLGRFGCEIDEIDADDIRGKAEELRALIEERKSALANPGDKTEQQIKAEEAWIENEGDHLSWYEVQLEYVETGHESYKQ